MLLVHALNLTGSFGRYCNITNMTGPTQAPSNTTYLTCAQNSTGFFLTTGSLASCTCGIQCQSCAYDPMLSSSISCNECKNKQVRRVLSMRPAFMHLQALYFGICIQTCPPGTVLLGAGSFGRYCAAVGVTSTTAPGSASTTPAPSATYCIQNKTVFNVAGSPDMSCTCTPQCQNCTYDISLKAPLACVTCKNQQYNYLVWLSLISP